MAIELPTKRREVQQYNPRLMVLFGRPKCGKSTIMASLDDNLIVDLEDGYRSLPVMEVQARKYADFIEIRDALRQKMGKPTNPPAYKYITIDNATRLEEMSLTRANQLYQSTSMGASWGWLKDAKNPMMNTKDKEGKFIPDPKADVRLLPNGAGYLYMRKAVREMVDMFKPYCETLILVAHVKDKQIRVESGEMTEMSVDLSGKTGDIICGEADAIGYIYREGKDTIMSFEGGEGSIREARPLHLRGKKFVVISSNEDNELTVDLSKVFL